MRVPRLFVVLLPGFLWCGGAVAAGDGRLRSGPQAGDRLPGPFNPVNVTNAEAPGYAGKRNDYVEQHGPNPVVLVFAREVSEPLTALVKKLDAEVARNRAARLRAVVVVLSDDEATEEKLKKLGEEEGIKNVSLALLDPPGPKPYKLSRSAEVTVLLYRDNKVKANHAFKKGELDAKAIGAVLRDVPGVVARRR
jgi:hypothetical protein